jgi:YihY family inner membrane protein
VRWLTALCPWSATRRQGADDTAQPPRPNVAETVVRRVDRFQQDHSIVGFPFAVWQKFGNDQATSRAALIAYYGLFALFPLLLLFTTILGYVLHGNDALRKDLVDSALGQFPIIGSQLQSETHTLEGSGAALAIGVLLLLYGALGLGQATQAGMNAVWNVPYVRRPSFILRQLRALGVLMLLALSTIGSTVLTGVATLVAQGWDATAILLLGSLAVNFVLISTAFKLMIAAPVRWREVAWGAGLATIFWQTMQAIGSWYVGRSLAHNSDTYGFFAIVIVFLGWVYLGAQLFLLAAEIDVVRRYHLWPRSMVQPPLTSADREVFDRLARMAVRRPETELSVRFSAEADRDPLDPAAGRDDARSPDGRPTPSS